MTGAAVLLTGATGFLGKVVLEDLLRRRAALGVERVYALVRAPDGERARRRFEIEVLNSECLVAHERALEDLVEVVAGDLCRDACGLGAEVRSRLVDRVTHIVHCAASIDFDLPVMEAAEINIAGALQVLELARECTRLEGMASVSTAYVTTRPQDGSAVEEVLAPLPRPAIELYEGIRSGALAEGALLRETGHPNTYTLTKCIAEHLLLERRADVPLALVRPSIISASRKHPFPGWIDSHAAFAGFVSGLGTGTLHVVSARPETEVDVVPVDEVACRAVDAAFASPPRAPMAAPIIHAVAGRGKCATVAGCAASIESYFTDRRVGRGPSIRYIGPEGPRLRLAEWFWQELPTLVSDRALWALRRPTKRRTAARLAERGRHLNRVFPYFTHNGFDFRSSRPLDADFESQAYLETVCAGVARHLLRQDDREFVLAGRQHRPMRGDARWALSQPRGRAGIRLAAFLLAKIFRRVTPRLSVDLPSFERALASVPEGASLVLAPSHRSYFDFLIIPYLCFARPELGIEAPHIAADEQFARIPVLSRLARACNAFFLRRGQGGEDKELTRQVHGLVRSRKTILFFIEGGRSRSREMLAPRRGLLRSLQATGQPVAILPIGISYDRVPEEATFALELAGGPRQRISLPTLAEWLRRVWRGEVDIGPVHVQCGAPSSLDLGSDVQALSEAVVTSIQAELVATSHQLRCFLARHPIDGFDAAGLERAIRERGGRVVQSRLRGERSVRPIVEAGMREQWQHLFLGEVRAHCGRPEVAHWLSRRIGTPRAPDPPSSDPRIAALLETLGEPVCRAYAAAATRVFARVGTGAVPAPVEIARERPDLFLPHLEAAFDSLCEQEILVAGGDGRRRFGPRAIDPAL